MSDFDFPADLVDLQCRFYELDARCETLAATHPLARDVLDGAAQVTPDQGAELAAARAERLEVMERMHAHEWWGGVDLSKRLEAKAAVRAAAKRAMSDTPSE